MITRTIKTNTATVLLANLKGETITQNYTVPTTDLDTATKWLRKNGYETDDWKVALVMKIETEEKLYGITEEDFRLNAVELDPVTRKPL